jgi:SAM-dependent methyltransferase
VPAPEQGSASSNAGHQWDRYVKTWHQGEQGSGLDWPGDEWGTPQYWDWLYEQLFLPSGVQGWERALEIGPGSGKYTLKVMADSAASLRAYDVSPQFLAVCEERCQDQLAEGRLSLHLLDSDRADQMLSELTECGWKRRLDGFFSIDAMVHVDLQDLIVYLLTAGAVLKPGGSLILTVANATTEIGFKKLVEDIAFYYRNDVPGKFEWISPEIVESMLPRLGFRLERIITDGADPRSILFAATLAEPYLADEMARYLAPRQASAQ